MKTCADLAKEEGFPGCCNSCHEDHDLGYDLCERYDDPQDRNQMSHRVCCKVNTWILEKRFANNV
jgi:hypothetical protein